MDKILERYLWNEICCPSDKEIWHSQFYRSPRDVIKEMLEKGWIKSHKQAYATLEKWVKKEKYEYGSRLDLGWKIKNESQ